MVHEIFGTTHLNLSWKEGQLCIHSFCFILPLNNKENIAGLFKQSMGARNRVGVGLSYRLARLQTGGIGSLKTILGLLKSLKIRALHFFAVAGMGSIAITSKIATKATP